MANGRNVLIVGAGPCGLRTAIEMAFLGASVTVIDSRKEFRKTSLSFMQIIGMRQIYEPNTLIYSDFFNYETNFTFI